MIAALAIITLALAWLALETQCLRVRLLVGPALAFEAPPPAMLRVKHGVGLWSVARYYAVGWLTLYGGMTYKWNRDRTGGKWHVNTSEVKQYRSTGVRVDAYCPKCQSPFSSNGRRHISIGVSTYTETVGNSTVTFTICDDCLPKLRAEIERSQCAKPSKPRPDLAEPRSPIRTVAVGSHHVKRNSPYGKSYVTDHKTFYDSCLPGKTWLRRHAKFQMPYTTIEIRIDGQLIGIAEDHAKQGTVKALVKAHL